MLICCNNEIKNFNLVLLHDIKGFTERKMLWNVCPNCKTLNLILVEKRIDDDKIFIDTYKGKSAIKVFAREKYNAIKEFPHIQSNNLKGWVYGHNVQIKNKKGKVTKIRQYAKGLDTGKTKLLKTIEINTR